MTYKERLRELGLLSLENAKTKEGSNGNLLLLKEFWGQGATETTEAPFSEALSKSKEGTVGSAQQGEF